MGATFHIEIRNTKPIELSDVTRSFLAIADEFRRYLDINEPEAAASDVRLYVKEVKSGSIIADVIAVSPQLLHGVAYFNTVVGFGKHLKCAYDFLSGKSNEKPELEKSSCENLSRIVEPIAKDHGSQLNLGTVNGNVYIEIGSTEANAAQNSARKEIDRLAAPESALHEKVLLYWYQARADANSKTGDRGIIESITKRPVKVVCLNDRIKAQMIFEVGNPFKEAYVVDVMVGTIDGKPALYTVLGVHDKFRREE